MCNTQGAPGAWRTLEALQGTPDEHPCAEVILIQELRMSDAEWQAFVGQARTKGYTAHRVPGPVSNTGAGTPLYNGGVATLVWKGLPCRPGREATRGSAQALVVEVAGWQIVNSYAPPTDAGAQDLVTVGLEVFQANGWTNHTWLWGGDFNAIPEESTCSAIAEYYGGTVLATEEGTRWTSDRVIDWFCSNAPNRVAQVVAHEERVSDPGSCSRKSS